MQKSANMIPATFSRGAHKTLHRFICSSPKHRAATKRDARRKARRQMGQALRSGDYSAVFAVTTR